MTKPRLLFLTNRSEWHQQNVLKYAPPEIDVIMKRNPAVMGEAYDAALKVLAQDLESSGNTLADGNNRWRVDIQV